MKGQSGINVAQELLKQAYKFHLEGNIDQAIHYYKLSIDVFPTAEAHTFLGWAYSLKGKYESAIQECYVAIELDRKYGNPYNDIGSYLIELGKYDKALPWLEKALNAERYSSKHFAYFNLGKLYEKKGNWKEAIDYYKKALEYRPDYEIAKKNLYELMGRMN